MPRLLADREPPISLEAERSVLGSILLDNTTADDVLPVLRVADFHRDVHKTVFESIRDLLADGKPADAVTLADDLIRREQFDRIGGDDALREIVESVPHAANAGYYAGIVREMSRYRGLIDAASETLKAGYRRTDTADDLIRDAEERIFALAEVDSRSDVRPVDAVAEETMDRMTLRLRDEMTGLSTGFHDLDHHTGGFKPGEVTILAGRPSMGKTAFAMEITFTAARSGPVLFVSVEMGSHSFGDRMVPSRARIDGYKFQRPWTLTEDERARLTQAAFDISRLPIEVDFSPTPNVTSIAAVARRIKRRRGSLALVVIDYINLLDGELSGGNDTREREVAKISSGIRKRIARAVDVPVLVLSQLNRQVEQRPDKRPVMSDLRESGAVEQDADTILLMYRPEYYNPDDRPGIAEVIVAKNRNGSTGTVQLTFTKAHARFDAVELGPAPTF